MTGKPNMTEADHEAITAAVHAAEGGSAGEIVTIVADQSDQYLDIAMWWSVLAGVIGLAALALFPAFYAGLLATLSGGWVIETTVADALELALAVFIVKFVAMRLLMEWKAARLWLTPKRIKAGRVRRRAVRYFKVGAESRTTGRTGILIYLSMAEHVAEIVADEAIHSKVQGEIWGEAMAKLVGHVRNGRIADGMIAAIQDVGLVLTQHLPRANTDVNELPDRLIEL